MPGHSNPFGSTAEKSYGLLSCAASRYSDLTGKIPSDFMEEAMSDQNASNDLSKQWVDKSKAADSAERKEDYVVLLMAAITVVLVMSGTIGSTSFNSLFF
jgi:hypothetical protein